MLVFNKINTIRGHLSKVKESGKRIGFVPTMGALHQGHLDLLASSKKKDDHSVVSIFVNPAQFNDSNDYRNYPVDLYRDITKLDDHQGDVVFVPSEQEMYPEPDNRSFDFGRLDKVMEGKHRPGHFNGVAKIVSRLFDVVQPHRAYFGEKDYQQLLIVKTLVHKLGYSIDIVPVPISRAEDGLALSSRNQLLSSREREMAPFLYHTLQESKQMQGDRPLQEVKDWVCKQLENHPDFNMDYFDIVNQENLETVEDWNDNCRKIGCIAAFLNNVRLIDNIKYN